jgi:Kef-type K+ transport system membrane component KefB
MAVTAFPVLARILTDRGLQRTRLGAIAIGVAAAGDVTAWCLLALVVSVVHDQMASAFLTVGLTALFIAGILVLLRPLLKKVVSLLESRGQVSEGSIALIFIAVLVSALTTEYIGVHAIFGAFLLGSVIPHDSRIATEVTHRLEDIVRVMLLPVFFAYTGMHTEFGLLSTVEDWLFCGLIVLVATAGKFGGTFVTAKLASVTTQDAASLGILMNTRGLVELVVLNIGLQLGIISPRLFAMLVLMARSFNPVAAPVESVNHLVDNPLIEGVVGLQLLRDLCLGDSFLKGHPRRYAPGFRRAVQHYPAGAVDLVYDDRLAAQVGTAFQLRFHGKVSDQDTGDLQGAPFSSGTESLIDEYIEQMYNLTSNPGHEFFGKV